MKKITTGQIEAASDKMATSTDENMTKSMRLIASNEWMFIAEKNQFEEMRRRSIRGRLRHIWWYLKDYRSRIIMAIEVLRGNHYCD